MQRRISFIIMLIVASAVCNASGTDKLLERLLRFGQFIPQEKVYVHMDNTCYWLGDTIWFAAYMRRSSDDKPSDISKILYVELINQDGYLMERKLIEMKDGFGHGNLVIKPSYYYGGFYELRAYTRWQLNWGRFERTHSRLANGWFINDEKEAEYFRDYDKLYSRVFPVYDEPREEGVYYHDYQPRAMRRYFKENIDKHDLQLSLFPEGGNLVRGVPCRVAFEATRGDGEWVDGVLKIGNDTAVTVNRGRGTITVCSNQDNLEAVFFCEDGDLVRQKLPALLEEGVTISLTRGNDAWFARIEVSGGLNTDSMAVSIMHEGVLRADYSIVDKSVEINIPDSILPSGVNQITVFDSEGRVWADRLFFVTHPEDFEPTLNLFGLKGLYAPFDSVELSIQSVDSLPNVRVSVAVCDSRHADRPYDNAGIMAEMLLASEIKGFVPDAEWYFEKDDEKHRRALDLLMMTQGWRRFRWQDMSVSGSWEIVHPAEKHQILFGRVTNPVGMDFEAFESPRDNSLGDGSLKREVCVHAELISMQNAERAIVEDMTSDNGRFRLTIPNYYGSCVFFLSAADTTKWKSREQYQWIEVEPTGEDNRFSNLKNTWRFRYKDTRDMRVCLDFPYPRFAKRYNYYQTRLMSRTSDDSSISSEADVHNMREVEIRARHNGKRRFSDAAAAFSIDAYEAYNQAYDAGFVWFSESSPSTYSYARMLVGDMGLERPYTYVMGERNVYKSSKIKSRYGENVFHRMLKDSIPVDSIYSLKYLHSTKDYASLPSKEREIYDHLYNLDRFVVYTDYMPRLSGDERYKDENLPDVDIVVYPFSKGEQRVTYRDRRLILPGFSIADDFYHPNYSSHPLPEVKDYRRTLYWNPDLKLDEKGKAVINFFNNSKDTSLSISINGMDTNGNLITY